MSTFVLLTITGLGLGAMYFLIASGLSLIYGLMGVLNFAHGAFLTVGAYATVVRESKLGGVPVLPRFLIAALAGLVVGAVFAALVELVLIRPLYGRHIEQVLVTVGLALARDRARDGDLGQRRACRRGARRGRPRRRRSSARTSRTTAGSRSRRRSSCSFGARGVPAPHAVRPDHPGGRREPRDGDRARDRRAPRVHARLRDRRPRRRARRRSSPASTSTTVDPQQGTSLLIFAFIVVVIGGLGSIRGTAWSRPSSSGSSSSTRTTTPRRGSATSASCCCSGSSCSRRPRGLSGSFA